VPNIFWKRSIKRYNGDDMFGLLRALLVPYTTGSKSVNTSDLLASYRIIFNSPGCPLIDELEDFPDMVVVGSILQYFRYHSVHNRLARKLFEYAPKVDAPWNDLKFAGKRYIGLYCMTSYKHALIEAYIAFWDLETLREDIHLSMNSYGHLSKITTPPEAIFDQLQWFQMPDQEPNPNPSSEGEEVKFRFRGRGEDSYVFLANGRMNFMGSLYENPHFKTLLKYWTISFDKHYIDEQNGETLWHYEGCVLPNGVIVGRWSDGLSDPADAVEGPMIFFPID